MIITFLIAFCVVLILLLVITLISSIINIFKLGYKEYFERFKLLLSLYNKLNVSFFIKQNKKYSYNNTKIVNVIEYEYYFPIYKSYTNLILVRKGAYRIHIEEHIEINNKWENKGREIKFELCIFGKMLHDLFKKKVEKLSKNAIEISNMDELNNYLNSELISFKREIKLKNLLNG